MNKFLKVFFVILICIVSSRCTHSSSDDTLPLRDYAVQYATDIESIETYLKTHYVTVTNHPGFADDQNVVFSQIGTGGTQTSIWNMPNLSYRIFTQNSVDYKIYYLKLRNGVGDSPCNVDAVLTSYKGTLVSDESVFDSSDNPQNFFNLENVIKAWSEIFPQFKSGTYLSNTDGSVTYNDFGAGIMFIPSGLGYYGIAQTTIPAYSPLIFSFKLYAVKRLDQDQDGIPSYLEDIGGPGAGNEHTPDGYVYSYDAGVYNVDDTDADSHPDYLDQDDDGDNVLTKIETRYTDSEGGIHYYPYNGASVDDPTTPLVDESKGIPSRSGTSPNFIYDYITPTRLRRHVDPTW